MKKLASKPSIHKKASPAEKERVKATFRSIVPAKSKALVPSKANFEEDAGAGQENMTRDDYAIPRLVILQDMSPQVKKADPKFIPNADVGDIADTVAGNVWSGEEGIIVVPFSYRRTHIEWKLRTKGGGFVKDHGPDFDISQATRNEDTGMFMLKNGNQIATVSEYFVFVVNEDGSYSPYVIGMAGSQLKKARAWNTLINQLRVPTASGEGTFNPAMFYRSYLLTTVPERNEKGDWIGWKITPGENTVDLPDGEALYYAAREFRKNVAEGRVTAAAPTETGEFTGRSETEGDDVPM